MKRLAIAAAAVLLIPAGMSAQTAGGGISADMLKEISKGYAGTAADKALRNALNTTSITVLAENADNLAMIDTHFSDKVKTRGITDQKSSGRCWLFSGLNVLRARMIDKFDLGDFTFSQNYLFFYDQLEKANLFLQGVIDTRDLPFDDRKVDWLFANPIGDGGQFTGVSNLIMKYGLVPAEVMPETLNANSTSAMSTQIKTLLRQDGLKLRAAGRRDDLQAMKTEMLKDVYHILALCLGVPPTEFEWARYNSKGEFVSSKVYTPKAFYEEFIGADLENNYIMVMNDPTREYYKVYEIENYRNCYEGVNWVYLNLPNEEMKAGALATIKDGEAVYASCDWRKGMVKPANSMTCDSYDYDSLFGMEFGMDKKARILTRFSASAHAMLIIACDTDENDKPTKWKFFNSWFDTGEKSTLTFTDEWFDGYIFRLALNRKYLSEKALQALETKHVMLPFWDYMN